ncbi:MAG: hypothetical protein ACR2QC_07795 [Gammaproteobacteria bacterium]
MAQEIVPVADYAVMKRDPKEVAALLKENLGGTQIDRFALDRIKIPAGGGTIWSVPSLEGDQGAKSIEGVVIDWFEPRAYWATSFDESGGGTPPDCASEDGLTGRGQPGGDCAKCPLSQFGSAPGKKNGEFSRGQACRQARVLFLLRPSLLLPQVVICPPTSLGAVRQFFLRLASNMVPISRALCSFKLEEDRNADGIKYSKMLPSMVRQLGDEEAAKVESYAKNMRPMLRQAIDLQRGDLETPPAS